MLLTVGCSSKVSVVSGQVVRISGNQMPSPDLPQSDPRGWETTVYFFSPSNPADFMATGVTGVYRKGDRLPIAAVKTDATGFFRTRLRPGTYSVLIARDSLTVFTNITNAEGVLNPLQLEKGVKKKIRLEAAWDAVY